MLSLYRFYEDLADKCDKVDAHCTELDDIFSNRQDDWDKQELIDLLGKDMPIYYGDEIISVSELPDDQLFTYIEYYRETIPRQLKTKNRDFTLLDTINLFEFAPIQSQGD